MVENTSTYRQNCRPSNICDILVLSEDECKPEDYYRTISYAAVAQEGTDWNAEDGCDDAGCGAGNEPCSVEALCPQSAILPFFSARNVIGAVVLVAIGYLVWSQLGKRGKKKGGKK